MRNLILLVLAFFVLSCRKDFEERSVSFPKTREYIARLPKKENFWIFILAGQSNMAGRGLVTPEDTISTTHVLAIDTILQWYFAKEPLHFYEPSLKGLDCGLAFGKELDRALNDSIYIGIVPCAVGGSSAEQWLGDSLHRNVKLYSNFESKVKAAGEVGVIKGILWHQGESNAHPGKIKPYRDQLEMLFGKFRTTVGNDSLPIVVGELGSFMKFKNGLYADSINQVLWQLKNSDRNIQVVKTDDLTHRGDSVHFDSQSLRTMGKRFADEYKLILK